jgi:hypothetical protein
MATVAISLHDLVFHAFAEPALGRFLRGLGKLLATVAESAPAAARGQLLHACAEAPDAPSLRRAWRAQEALLKSVVDLLRCSWVLASGLRWTWIVDSSGRVGVADELAVEAGAPQVSANTDCEAPTPSGSAGGMRIEVAIPEDAVGHVCLLLVVGYAKDRVPALASGQWVWTLISSAATTHRALTSALDQT